MKRNLLEKSYKYILGAAALPLLVGCAPEREGRIVGKADNSLYVDLDGDSIADQKLMIVDNYYADCYEYANVGDSILYRTESSAPCIGFSNYGPNQIKKVNSLTKGQIVYELEMKKMRSEIGQEQKTR